MSYMLDWAQNEVKYAIDREMKVECDDEEGVEYVKGCYESALKAYKSLCEDGHSGMSFGITTDILYRLIRHRPLTPLQDRQEDWEENWDNGDGVKHYVHKRLSSLFKDVYPDGKVEYNDVDAYECMEEGSDIPYHGGGSSDIFYKYFPIKFPYYPPNKKYRIITKVVLSDPKNGDFDTVAYLKIIAPDGNETSINRYFGETGNGWQELDCYEFYHRCCMEDERRKSMLFLRKTFD